MAYLITPMRKGNNEICRYTEKFVDRVGNVADITYCDYVDKKGKLVEHHTLFIKWRAK